MGGCHGRQADMRGIVVECLARLARGVYSTVKVQTSVTYRSSSVVDNWLRSAGF